MTYTITENPAFNSLEIAFNGKPSEAVRDALKALRFRWHSVKKVWYGYSDKETVRAAISGEKTEPKKTEPKKTENKYGIKPGDLFVCSWGWEQTNIDFFQVVSVTASGVRVRGCSPAVIDEDAVSHMSRYISFRIPGEILPAARNIFVKDDVNGDLHKLLGDADAPYFKFEGRYYCRPYHGEKLYESWYA